MHVPDDTIRSSAEFYQTISHTIRAEGIIPRISL